MYKTPVQLTRETWLLTSDSARQLKQVQAFLEIIEEIQRGKEDYYLATRSFVW